MLVKSFVPWNGNQKYNQSHLKGLLSFANISILGTAYIIFVSKGLAFLPFPKRENWNVARTFFERGIIF